MVQPREIGEALRQAREAWQLSPAELAERTLIPERTVRLAERTGRVPVAELAALATALGGSFDDLLAGRSFWNAMSIALKTSEAAFEQSLVRTRVIALASAANLERSLARFLALPDLWSQGAALGPAGLEADLVKQAEALAMKVRKAVGAGSEPLSSLRAFAARLGVSSFLADLGTSRLDGLMWRERGEAPCIAANVAARGGAGTAIRMTFAHELCHALFDRPKAAATGLLEQRTEDAVGREQRANAFAAYLIAPRGAVLDALARLGWEAPDVPTAQHLRSLAQFFGMGVEAMAYHLVNCGVWTVGEALKRKTFSVPYASDDDREHAAPTPAEQLAPLERRGRVLDLATQALALGRISIARWREILGLGLHADWRVLLAERQVEA